MKNANELEQLAEGLLLVPAEKFNLGYWGQGQLDRRSKTKFDCDFAGCAMGWMKKLVPRTKLKFDDGYCPFLTEEGWKFTGFNAIARYFDISVNEADYLFNSACYKPEDIRNPVAVANRIKELLNDPY
jgi:hypothetical protein